MRNFLFNCNFYPVDDRNEKNSATTQVGVSQTERSKFLSLWGRSFLRHQRLCIIIVKGAYTTDNKNI